MSMPWTAEAKERAAAEGRYLVKVIVQGKHVDGARFEVVGDMGPAQGRELLRTVLRTFGVVAVPDVVPDATADRDALHDLLSLVVRPSELPPWGLIAEWTAETCVKVERWASFEHLHASDDNVRRVPPPHAMREFLDLSAWPCGHGFDWVNDHCAGCGRKVGGDGE